MTNPVSLGYPDWARRTPMADQSLIRSTVNNAPVLTNYGPFYVANLDTLWVHFTAGNDVWRVSLTWAMDSAMTQQIGASTIDCTASTLLNRSFRPLAPYVKVTVNAATGGIGNFTLLMNSVPDVHMPSLTQAYINPISRYLVNIPATTTVVFSSSIVFIGPAVWAADCTAAIWEARLQSVNFFGGISELDRCAKNRGDMLSRPVYLGGGGTMISLQNFDGAAQLAYVYLNQASDVGL